VVEHVGGGAFITIRRGGVAALEIRHQHFDSGKPENDALAKWQRWVMAKSSAPPSFAIIAIERS